MKIEYDKEADAVYIMLANEVREGGIARSYHCDPIEVNGIVNLDFDKNGKFIGIEVMDASKKLPPEVLENSVLPGLDNTL